MLSGDLTDDQDLRNQDRESGEKDCDSSVLTDFMGHIIWICWYSREAISYMSQWVSVCSSYGGVTVLSKDWRPCFSGGVKYYHWV
jgi:hypothetical protein